MDTPTSLPAPVTTTDEWLAAVHRELVGLRADLAAGFSTAAPDAVTVVTEPAARPARKTNRATTR